MVPSELGYTNPNSVWVSSPSRGYASEYALHHVQPLPPSKPARSNSLSAQLAAMKQSVDYGGRTYYYQAQEDKWRDKWGDGPAVKAATYVLFGLAGLKLNKQYADKIPEETKDTILVNARRDGDPVNTILGILYPNAKDGDVRFVKRQAYVLQNGAWNQTDKDNPNEPWPWGTMTQWERDRSVGSHLDRFPQPPPRRY